MHARVEDVAADLLDVVQDPERSPAQLRVFDDVTQGVELGPLLFPLVRRQDSGVVVFEVELQKLAFQLEEKNSELADFGGREYQASEPKSGGVFCTAGGCARRIGQRARIRPGTRRNASYLPDSLPQRHENPLLSLGGSRKVGTRVAPHALRENIWIDGTYVNQV